MPKTVEHIAARIPVSKYSRLRWKNLRSACQTRKISSVVAGHVVLNQIQPQSLSFEKICATNAERIMVVMVLCLAGDMYIKYTYIYIYIFIHTYTCHKYRMFEISA